MTGSGEKTAAADARPASTSVVLRVVGGPDATTAITSASSPRNSMIRRPWAVFASRAAGPRNGAVQRTAVTLALAGEALAAAWMLMLPEAGNRAPGSHEA
jgi:hypothetical protein